MTCQRMYIRCLFNCIYWGDGLYWPRLIEIERTPLCRGSTEKNYGENMTKFKSNFS